MSETAAFFFYVLPNYILAAIMYTLLGRYILALVFKPDSQLVFWRTFCQITDPVLHLVRAITPAVVPNGLVMVLAIFWTLLLRILIVLVIVKFGLLPKAGA